MCAGGIFPSHLVTANISEVTNETIAYHVSHLGTGDLRRFERMYKEIDVVASDHRSACAPFWTQAVNPSPYTKTQRLREAFARRTALRTSAGVMDGEAIAEWCDPAEQCSPRALR